MRGLAQIAPLDRADVVISDTGLPERARSTLADLGIDVALVTPRNMSGESAGVG